MNRLTIIKPYIIGKKVLDIGSIGNYDDSLYYQLKPYCKSIQGTDIRQGDNKKIIKANMEYVNLKQMYEVVVAGDVIEHMHNQGLFIKNMIQHLYTDGILIITTPNAQSLYPFITFMTKAPEFHTLWHDKNTIKNVLKPYFEIERICYLPGNRKKYEKFIHIPLLNRNQMIVIARRRSTNE